MRLAAIAGAIGTCAAFACGAPRPLESAPSHAAVTSAPADASTPPRVLGAEARLIDTTDWSAVPPGATIDVVWTVHRTPDPAKAARDPFSVKVPIDLALTLAGKVHKVSLVGNAAGPFGPSCARDDAHIEFFYAGQSLGFSVELVPPDQAVIAVHEASGDSADSTDHSTSNLYVFRVPRGVHLQQRVLEVGDDGKTVDACP